MSESARHLYLRPSSGEAGGPNLASALRRRALGVLGSLLDPDEPYALVDFPNHTNVGDSAIWLGELSLLRSLRARPPRYTCDYRNYSRHELAARVRGGTILLNGGGNFGDLYPHHQELREAVIQAFPRNRIIQLPQSLHFRSREALERAARTCDAHPDFALLVRDQVSINLAERTFRSRIELCPDLAFGLKSLPKPAQHRHGIVFLKRRDREARLRPARAADPEDVMRADWPHEEGGLSHRVHAALQRRAGRHHWLGRMHGVNGRLRQAMARYRLEVGCRLLGRGRAVITDRLHAHVFCLLMRIPHCVLDNSYGKVRGCWDTWTCGTDLAVWCNDEAEALDRVRTLPGMT
ncbi:MAG TPA: polysaccharide pyruvyl transferase family protein [Gemmatimonadales bacterium]|jgi:exopolysaccharide biosynthesis predicted pyruvyltransferase EpsI|nr:polysaccharide pyruvyl transferase family protein [Gemmatimonadales bacterium]